MTPSSKFMIVSSLSLIALLLCCMVFVSWKFSDSYPKSEHKENVSVERAIIRGHLENSPIRLTIYDEVVDEVYLSEVVESVYLELDEYTIFDHMFGSDRGYKTTLTFDKKALCERLQKLCIEGKDACVSLTPDGVVLEEEVMERVIDVDKLYELITHMSDFEKPIELKSYITCNTVTSDMVRSEYEEIAWLNDWHVHYDNGYTVDYSYLYEYLDTGTIIDWSNAVSELSSYNTNGNIVNFLTYDGEKIDINNVTYGLSLDCNDEVEFLEKAYESKTSYDNRFPATDGFDGDTNTYIEISIADQHLWHLVEGELCCESDVVTGTQDLHDTPKGAYYISECIDGKYLRGDDYVTWVNKWMRITNQGHGLHDATWRSKFGGDIYTYDGSHGCINLPKNFAYNLFKEVERGARVVIY